jgi:bifunctional DNA-binding transcriptional regulator/antitoxin component of YhaV-PrlF toxin-antitoxin module
MRTTIDAAGRLVVPRAIREQVGVYGPTDVEVELDGAAIRIEPVTDDTLAEEEGRLVIPQTGTTVNAETVERLRDADRR